MGALWAFMSLGCLCCAAFFVLAKRGIKSVFTLCRLIHVGVLVFVALTLICLREFALAGALTQDQGKGIQITTVTLLSGRTEFNNFGNQVPVATYKKQDLASWYEYGVLPWLTYVATSDANNVSVGAPENLSSRGLGLSGNGLRALIWSQNSLALSTQILEQVQSDKTRLYPALVGLPPSQTDFRVMGGWYNYMRNMPSYFEVEGAYLLRTGGAANANEWHVDLTAGIRPRQDWLVLAQMFTIISDRLKLFDKNTHYTSTKAQFSAVYDFNETWSYQFGAYISIAGSNTLREKGVVMAVWRRF